MTATAPRARILADAAVIPDDCADLRQRLDEALDDARAGRPWDARVLDLACADRLDALAAAVGCEARRRTGAWLGRECDEDVRGRVRARLDGGDSGRYNPGRR